MSDSYWRLSAKELFALFFSLDAVVQQLTPFASNLAVLSLRGSLEQKNTRLQFVI